jgi:hypothetical protein
LLAHPWRLPHFDIHKPDLFHDNPRVNTVAEPQYGGGGGGALLREYPGIWFPLAYMHC